MHNSRQQQKAICHTYGPARIIAGPGSGKTTVIIQRISYLVHHIHVPPEQILCVTFSKAAANEMQERYHLYMKNNKKEATENVCFGTVHSICYHILKESGKFRNYSLIQESHKRKILEILLQNKNIHCENEYDVISELLNDISRKKNGLTYHKVDFLSADVFEELYQEYQTELSERHLFDFDDMIKSTYDLLSTYKILLNKWQKRFIHVIVDEFQDINFIQYQVIKLLSLPQNNLFVVGDDDQAIYGFRGALPDIMSKFINDFPDAANLFLTENYRSRQKIVQLAGRLISKNKNRISKDIFTQKGGGEVSIHFRKSLKDEEIKILTDIQCLETKLLQDSAIIVRTNRDVRRYNHLLETHHIPIKGYNHLSSNNIFEHFICKDFESFLLFCKEGYHRNDFLKIINKPEMFLSSRAFTEEIVTLTKLLQFYKNNPEMQTKIKQLFYHINKAANMSFAMAIRYFRKIIGYDNYLKNNAVHDLQYQEYMKVADTLQNLCKQQKEGEQSNDFWMRMKSDTTDIEQVNSLSISNNNNTSGISILTMHGAKGLEFTHVFLPDINEGIIPGKQCVSDESIEEERRLLYVAVTRAKDAISVYYTGERGRKPSRFIAHEKLT